MGERALFRHEGTWGDRSGGGEKSSEGRPTFWRGEGMHHTTCPRAVSHLLLREQLVRCIASLPQKMGAPALQAIIRQVTRREQGVEARHQGVGQGPLARKGKAICYLEWHRKGNSIKRGKREKRVLGGGGGGGAHALARVCVQRDVASIYS